MSLRRASSILSAAFDGLRAFARSLVGEAGGAGR